MYPTAWERRAQEAERRGRSGPNLIVYRTLSGDPRDHYVVPFSVAPRLKADDATDQGIVEGIEREIKLIAKSRSPKLRRLALERAKGHCEACGTDFGTLFGGIGLRVLQVHHKQQLALRSVPAVTSPRDVPPDVELQALGEHRNAWHD